MDSPASCLPGMGSQLPSPSPWHPGPAWPPPPCDHCHLPPWAQEQGGLGEGYHGHASSHHGPGLTAPQRVWQAARDPV